MSLKTKLAELIVDINAKLDPLKGQLAKANAMLKRGFASMVRMAKRAALAIGVGLVAAFAWATKNAMKQEDAEIALARALARTNDATKKNIARYKKFASAMQEVTLQGDEETLMLMAKLKVQGVATDKLEGATRAYIGFTAQGLRGNTAIKAAVALMKGNTTQLTSYIIGVRLATTQAGKMAAVQEYISAGLAKAKASTETTTGAMVQLKMTIGDVSEVIAKRFLPKIKELAKLTKKWAADNEKLIESRIGEWLDRIGEGLVKIGEVAQFVYKHWKKFAAALAVVIFAKVLVGLAAIYTALTVLVGAVAAALMVVSAFGVAIGLLATGILVTLRNYIQLRKMASKLEQSLTKEEIEAYRRKHSLMKLAAHTLRVSNKKEFKDIESLTAARKKLREEMDKHRKLGGNDENVFKAALALAKAVGTERTKSIEVKAAEVLARAVAAKVVAGGAPPTEEERDKIKADALLKLKALRDYYVKVGGYEKKLAVVKKTLRLQEAVDIAKKIGGDALKIFKELEAAARKAELEAALRLAKKTPAEVAKLGLVSFEASWGQLATGAKRIDEQQLATMKKIKDELRQIKEQGRPGMQNTGSRRF